MPKKDITLVEKIWASLYKKPDEACVQFTDGELEVKRMYEDVFAKWLDDPGMLDKDMVQHLENEYGRSKTQAYRDIASVKFALGNVKNATKEWSRFMVIETLKDALKQAKNKKDYYGMIMAADKLGKYTKLDKDEAEEIPWDQIVPPSFEPTDDITVLGLKKIPNLSERRKILEKKYLSRRVDISDAEIVDDEHTA